MIHLTNEEIREFQWLLVNGELPNLLDDPFQFNKDNLQQQFFTKLLDPDYFYITCKYILGVDLLPMQQVVLKELWTHKFPLMVSSRGFGKTFLMAVYALLRMLFLPEHKVVICGAGFRQSKLIFSYMDKIWNKASVLRDIAGAESRRGNAGVFKSPDQWEFRLLDSVCYAIPIGTGEKIRGLRANTILADETASIPEEVYQTVIAGFAAVSASPVENVKRMAEKKILADSGIILDEDMEIGNQTILTGTAYYDFNWFCNYWKQYKAILQSQGNPDKVREIFQGDIPRTFDWRNYAIIRVPYELIPEGFMDDEQVARSRATVNSSIYHMEYGAVFSKDSNGFFSRRLIESCVTNQPISKVSGEVQFETTLKGIPDRKYVIGVDPASENDNFSIVVLELHDDHRRVVYAWSTTRQRHKQILKQDSKLEEDFYRYCSRKIRDLMKVFSTAAIALDSQGGGVHIAECLRDGSLLEAGEIRIWPIIEEGKEKDTDHYEGLHILHMINFASADWTSQANHALRGDFEGKMLLFPRLDPLTIGLAAIDDQEKQRAYDTYEDIIWEIEELKDELSTIVITQTPSGRDRWDTPEIKLAGSKKGRMRKDRYSALLMANMVAHGIYWAPPEIVYNSTGGFANQFGKRDGKFIEGPEWATSALKDAHMWYGVSVRRN